MSLRTRLLLALLGVVAAGMLVAGAVTYTSLRSFLMERVDQLRRVAHLRQVERQLLDLVAVEGRLRDGLDPE